VSDVKEFLFGERLLPDVGKRGREIVGAHLVKTERELSFIAQWGALIRLEKTENGAKQNSAVKTKWLLIVFWGPPNNLKKISFNFVCP
jgi:hypothetical protein